MSGVVLVGAMMKHWWCIQWMPTGGDKQSNESPFRANIEYDIDYKNPAIPVGIPRHQGNEMLFIPQWLLSQEDN